MVRWVTPTRMAPISSPALRLSQQSARRPGFRTAWYGCSRGSLASIIWTLKTLAHAPDWLGTSSAMARPHSELVTLWLTTWQILRLSARLTLSRAPELGRLQTPTWAFSRSQRWGTAVRAPSTPPPENVNRVSQLSSKPLGRTPVITRRRTLGLLTGFASVRKREAQTRPCLSRPMVPIPRAHRRLTFSELFRI